MYKHKLKLFGFVLLLWGIVFGRFPSRAQQLEATSVRNQFLGTWKLISTEEKLKDGTTRPYKDLGSHAQGYLMYTPDGHMCAALMNPDRPKLDPKTPPDQKLVVLEAFVAYCGTFKIDEAHHVMLHFPEVAWIPGYVGTEQRRPYTLANNRLTFSDKATGADFEPDVDRWSIVWEKVK